ncbi:MAG: hypothetical protein ACTJLM_01540 [Ehrlichia sp.]
MLLVDALLLPGHYEAISGTVFTGFCEEIRNMRDEITNIVRKYVKEKQSNKIPLVRRIKSQKLLDKLDSCSEHFCENFIAVSLRPMVAESLKDIRVRDISSTDYDNVVFDVVKAIRLSLDCIYRAAMRKERVKIDFTKYFTSVSRLNEEVLSPSVQQVGATLLSQCSA